MWNGDLKPPTPIAREQFTDPEPSLNLMWKFFSFLTVSIRSWICSIMHFFRLLGKNWCLIQPPGKYFLEVPDLGLFILFYTASHLAHEVRIWKLGNNLQWDPINLREPERSVPAYWLGRYDGRSLENSGVCCWSSSTRTMDVTGFTYYIFWH